LDEFGVQPNEILSVLGVNDAICEPKRIGNVAFGVAQCADILSEQRLLTDWNEFSRPVTQVMIDDTAGRYNRLSLFTAAPISGYPYS
jgi:hypothetical protein